MIKQQLYLNKCRTCLGQTKIMNSLDMLADEAEETQFSFAELLKEVTNVNVYDDKKVEMPQQICICCSRKLKSSHAFIKQVREVNGKLCSLINQTVSANENTDCLEEAEIDIEKCLEIKMEDDGDEVDVTEKPRNQGNTADLHSFSYNEQLKMVDLPSDNVLCEKKVLRIELDNGNEGNDVSHLMYNHENDSDSEHVAKGPDDNEGMENNSIAIKLAQLNCPDVSNLKRTYTEIDSDDDKYLSSLKADMRNRKDEQFLATEISSKRKKKIKRKVKSAKTKDDDIPVPCQKCNKIFNNSKELSTHLRNSHVPEDQKCACPVCGATFTRTCNMYTHMRSFHENEYRNIKSPSKERMHECEICRRKYASIKNLKYHIKLKHNKDEEEDPKEAETINEGKAEGLPKKNEIRPLCSICGASVCNKAQLIIHMRRHTGEKPFKCEQCDRSFLQISDLNTHRRLHTGEKPYKCKLCGKSFRVSTKLANHMRSHTDERPYKCLQCERSFKYSKDLNIHHRIHTGERPYSCNVCGNTFTQSNSLKTHRMKLGHMDVTSMPK